MSAADRRGRFVVFEGIEGAGKTTAIRAVAERLAARGLDPLVTREPGGTDLGRSLRQVLLDSAGPPRDPLVEALLMCADRAEHLHRVVRPALAAGRLILSDRYEDATFAYQGGGSGVPASDLETLSQLATRGLRPDLVVWLDLPVAAAHARLAARGRAFDRFEAESVAFFERVRDAYRLRAEREPERWWILNAERDAGELADAIAERVAALGTEAATGAPSAPAHPQAGPGSTAGGRRSALW